MQKFKVGDVFYRYDPLSISVRKWTIMNLDSEFVYVKWDNTIYGDMIEYNRFNSYLTTEDCMNAFRKDKLEIIKLVCDSKSIRIKNKIESHETEIQNLRQKMYDLDKWRKKEIGMIPTAPKKAITINCSLPTFVITQ